MSKSQELVTRKQDFTRDYYSEAPGSNMRARLRTSHTLSCLDLNQSGVNDETVHLQERNS